MKVLSKIKNSKLGKYIATTMVAAAIAAMGCINCFAADGDPGVANILQTAFNSVKTDIMTYIGVVLPIALGIFAIFFGIKKAIHFFRQSAGKG